jgi:PAS domain S-box-containing protein
MTSPDTLSSPHLAAFRQLFDELPIATAVIDREQRYLYANRALGELLGRDVDEIVGMPVAAMLRPDDFARCVEQARREVAAGRRSFQIEMPFQHRDGHPIHTLAANVLLSGELASSAQLFMQLISVDWQREMEARLAQAHAQRDLLVREVHHRIKNNLQSVAGLLQRQMRRTPAATEALRAAIAQVETIATVHGLQGGGSARGIQLCDVIASIVAQNNALHPTAAERCLLVNALGRPAVIAADETVALALVCNELVTNALKHGDERSPVEITLQRAADGCVSVAIVNGIDGPPAAFEGIRGPAAGMGLQLVKALLPEGAALQFHQFPDRVCAELALRAPLIQSQAEQHAS